MLRHREESKNEVKNQKREMQSQIIVPIFRNRKRYVNMRIIPPGQEKSDSLAEQ